MLSLNSVLVLSVNYQNQKTVLLNECSRIGSVIFQHLSLLIIE